MKFFIDSFRKNVLIKVSSINALGVIVKLITGILSSKAIALFLGAEGMAMIGNLRNAIASFQSLGTMGLYNGLVKYVAENKDSPKDLKLILSTATVLSFIATVIFGCWLYFGADFWNNLIFDQKQDFTFVFKIIGIALPFYAINILLLAVINGFSKYKTYVLVNSLGNVFTLCFMVFLIWKYNLKGAFIAMILAPVLSLLITLVFMSKKKITIPSVRINNASQKYVKLFGSYSIMALVSATLLPWVLIHIRNFIIDHQGAEQAGYWEAMQNISNQYMLFISTLLTLYILPKFSEIKSSKLFKLEVLNFYKVILPLFALGFVVIYVARLFIIQVLFSKSFYEMEQLFSWHLLGDLFKIASLVIAYQFLAKKMFWYYIITEIISLAFLYTISIYLISSYGWVGASMAHFFNYLFYFLLLIVVFRKSFFGPERRLD